MDTFFSSFTFDFLLEFKEQSVPFYKRKENIYLHNKIHKRKIKIFSILEINNKKSECLYKDI